MYYNVDYNLLSTLLFCSHSFSSLSLLVSHSNEGESGLDDESQDITGGTYTHMHTCILK